MSVYITDLQVKRTGNTIVIRDLNSPDRVGDVINTIYKARHENLKKLILEIQGDTPAFPNVVVPLAALVSLYRRLGKEVDVRTSSTFCGLTELASPILASSTSEIESSSFFAHIWEFGDSSSVHALVKSTIARVSEKTECSPGVLDSLGWCLYEVMDNALRHSGLNQGFFSIQLHENGQLAISICDTGIGIHRSFANTRFRPETAVDAILLAIREGVTRDSQNGQGNGLYGLVQIVLKNSGILGITSGDGRLRIVQGSQETTDRIPYPRGHRCAFVDFQVNTKSAIDLNAVMPNFSPIDLAFDEKTTVHGDHVISLHEFPLGVGTREAGAALRNTIANALNRNVSRVVVDFSGLGIVSSSFADESIGKMVVRMGSGGFNQRVALVGRNEHVRSVVDRSVAQRVTENMGPSDAVESAS